MKIVRATREFEDWLAKSIKVELDDLQKKHEYMASDAFLFLRATYYRWAQLFTQNCKELKKAPQILSVGDLHVENFGTWRDSEGRLVWGVNDFDEAYPLPFANDLVRLATSAYLAETDARLALNLSEICAEILHGYEHGLNHGGKPFVLAESNIELRAMAFGVLRNPTHFWQRLDTQISPVQSAPTDAIRALERQFPEKFASYRVAKRRAGIGSLGRQRFVAIAEYRGGRIAREVKSSLPSAAFWADGTTHGATSFYEQIIDHAIRCPDPYLKARGKWIARRLAPDCSRVELSELPQARDERLLFNSMGREIANVHNGSKAKIASISKFMSTLKRNWLVEAVEEMKDSVLDDWRHWRAYMALPHPSEKKQI